MNEDAFNQREEEIKELYLRLLISDVESGNRSELGDLMSVAPEAIETWEESNEKVTDELFATLVAPKKHQIIGILRGTEREIEIDNGYMAIYKQALQKPTRRREKLGDISTQIGEIAIYEIGF
jgi:hypothetical protein